MFMRVAGHKWLGRRMGAGCRCFAGLLGLDEYGSERREIRGRTQKAQKLRRSRKRNTEIVSKSLEPVFMRLAGHKWLGRRMGAGYQWFALLCFGLRGLRAS